MPSRHTAVVLDTQVVLDCFYFDDPRGAVLKHALGDGLPWLATAAMRDELMRVLERGFGPRWPATAAPTVAAFDRHARLLPAPVASRLVCADRSDQKFIDLALAHGACLVTRDRALLALRRAAAAAGAAVGPPESWAP